MADTTSLHVYFRVLKPFPIHLRLQQGIFEVGAGDCACVVRSVREVEREASR